MRRDMRPVQQQATENYKKLWLIPHKEEHVAILVSAFALKEFKLLDCVQVTYRNMNISPQV